MILALDQSLSSTGYALFSVGDSVEVGTWPLCEGVKKRHIGFLELFRRLDQLHKENTLTAILHEEPISARFDKNPARIALFGLVAVIELFATSRKIDVFSYESKAWRGTFFSSEERKGKPDWKRIAIQRANQLGFDPKNDDEAEAIGILDHHLHGKGSLPLWRADNPFLEPLIK